MYEDTVIIFCTDHGAFAGHKGLFDKISNKIYHDDIIRTPLLMKLPGGTGAGTTVTEITESIDIFPTLVDVCGLSPVEQRLDSSSLRGLLTDQPNVARSTRDGGNGLESEPQRDRTGYSKADVDARGWWRDHAFSESYGMKALIAGRRKLVYYVASAEGELYDLETDPNEYRNLYQERDQQDTILQLKLRIIRRMTDQVSPRRQETIRDLFDDGRMRARGAMDKLFKWDKGVIDGGGFWMLNRDGYRLVYIPFDETLELTRVDDSAPRDGQSRNLVPCDDNQVLHRLVDELLDYIATKIRPISIMTGAQEERDSMLKPRGHGFC